MTNGRSLSAGLLFLTGDSPRTGSFLFTMISPLRKERSRSTVFHTFSFIRFWVLSHTQIHATLCQEKRCPHKRFFRLCVIKWTEPDNSRAFPQIVAELQEAVVQGQRDEVSLSVRLLSVVEDQTVWVVGHENHRHADFLPAWNIQTQACEHAPIEVSKR